MAEDKFIAGPDIPKASDVEILVVEDSPTQAMYLAELLKNQGYKVEVAGNGEEALEFLDSNRPTLVLTDVVMPGIDGYELCRRIKKDTKLESIPVILLTTLSDPVDIFKGLECGANNFVTKPYEADTLLSRIQYVLVNAALRREYAAGVGLEIIFAGQKHFLTAERMQIIDLLFSSFETAVKSKLEFEKSNKELKRALAEVRRLSGLLPICASCKKIRDDKGYWQQIEAYVSEHSEADFSHGICPECARKLYPDLDLKGK